MTIFAGQDLNQYSSWEKVTTPSGNVYYAVPGTGYIYDPVLSAARGKAILFVNPTAKKKEQEKAAKELKAAQSPLNQAIPVVAGTAGTIGSMYAVNALGPSAASTGAAALGGAGITAATPGIPGLAGGPALVNGAVAPGPTVGGTLSAAAPYLGIAGMGLGGLGVANAIDANDPTSGAISGAGFGLGAGMAAPLLLGLSNPLGWGALGLMALGGAGLGGGLTSILGKPSTKEIQAGRFKAAGREDLAGANAGRDYFAGTGGEKSRDEKFLTADAIRVNPDNFNAASDFDKWSKPAQDEFLNSLLKAGKVSERKGGIYYDDAFAKAEADRVREKYKVQDMGKQLADKKNARK